MRIKPYNHRNDFCLLESWISSREEHEFWSGGRLKYPLEPGEFSAFLEDNAAERGEMAFVMGDELERPRGFFRYSFDPLSEEGTLRSIIVDNTVRGRGYGREMLRLALRYAFGCTGAKAVRLTVFDDNTAARAFYAAVGFVPTGMEETLELDSGPALRHELMITREAAGY